MSEAPSRMQSFKNTVLKIFNIILNTNPFTLHVGVVPPAFRWSSQINQNYQALANNPLNKKKFLDSKPIEYKLSFPFRWYSMSFAVCDNIRSQQQGRQNQQQKSQDANQSDTETKVRVNDADEDIYNQNYFARRIKEQNQQFKLQDMIGDASEISNTMKQVWDSQKYFFLLQLVATLTLIATLACSGVYGPLENSNQAQTQTARNLRTASIVLGCVTVGLQILGLHLWWRVLQRKMNRSLNITLGRLNSEKRGYKWLYYSRGYRLIPRLLSYPPFLVLKFPRQLPGDDETKKDGNGDQNKADYNVKQNQNNTQNAKKVGLNNN